MSTVRLTVLCATTLWACDPSNPVDRTADIVDAGHQRDAGSDSACATALEGSEPFGARLQGTFALRDASGAPGGTSTQIVDIYFPDGRRPGRKVIYAVPQSFPSPTVNRAEAVLDDEGRASTVQVGGFVGGEIWFDLTLGTASDGVDAKVSVNQADPGSDVPRNAEGRGVLCRIGPPPEPILTAAIPKVGPLSAFPFDTTVPVDFASAVATASVDGVAVPLTTGIYADRLWLSAATAFPPDQEISWEVNIVDVLGRRFSIAAMPASLRTTTALAEGVFDANREGAIATSGFRTAIDDGRLIVQRPGHFFSERAGLVALGERVAVNETVRIRWHLKGCFQDSDSLQLLLVGSGGTSWSAPAVLRCADPSGVYSVPLHAAGNVWLAIGAGASTSRPQWSPASPEAELVIDAITFE